MGWWGVNCCSNSTVLEWLEGWFDLCPSHSRKRVWDTLFFAVVWTIWESRNEVVFRDSQVDLCKALDTIKFRVALWFKHHGSGSDSDLSLLILDLNER